MRMSTCSNCTKSFRSEAAFQAHPCVTAALADPFARLGRLLRSGGCSHEYAAKTPAFNERVAQYVAEGQTERQAVDSVWAVLS